MFLVSVMLALCLVMLMAFLSLRFVAYVVVNVFGYKNPFKNTDYCEVYSINYVCNLRYRLNIRFLVFLFYTTMALLALFFISLWLLFTDSQPYIDLYGEFSYFLMVCAFIWPQLLLVLSILVAIDKDTYHASNKFPCQLRALLSKHNLNKGYNVTHNSTKMVYQCDHCETIFTYDSVKSGWFGSQRT